MSSFAIFSLVDEKKNELTLQSEETLVLLHHNTMFKKKILEGIIRQILNSPEMIDGATQSDNFLKNVVIEDILFLHFKQSKTVLPDIRAIQFIDYQGNLLFSLDNTSPFDESRLEPIPKDSMLWLSMNDEKRHIPTHFFNKDTDGQPIIGFIQPFSARLFTDLNLLISNAKGISYAIITSNIAIDPNLENSLGLHYQTLLTRNTTKKLSEDMFETNIQLEKSTLTNSLYTATLISDGPQFEKSIKQIFYSIYLLAFIIALITYYILRSLFFKNLIKPLLRLSKKIKASEHDKNIHLSYIDNNDEISELNNAYLNLLRNDSLTGLLNRNSFLYSLQNSIEIAKKNDWEFSIIYIDLDNFKKVNDQYGHATGDDLLVEFSKKLTEITNNERSNSSPNTHYKNALARLSGDEFIASISNNNNLLDIVDDINSLFNNGFLVEKTRHNVYASIGIAHFPADATEAKELISCADAAMYAAKENGKNQYCIFSTNIDQKTKRRQFIEQTLSNALNQNALKLVFMPIYNTATCKIEAFEVLLRCPELAKTSIGPDEFIPIAESSGLIRSIDLWVLENAFQNFETLKKQHNFKGYLSINISGMELGNDAFPSELKKRIIQYKIDPQKIELEITETSLVSIDDKSLSLFHKIKALNVKISLDDFGTGYSSFNQLSSFPVDTLKIDKTFIDTLENINKDEHSLLNIILSLAELYNLKVIAEGVETKKQMDHLMWYGCHLMQGYYLSKPIPFDDLVLILHEKFQEPQHPTNL
ncbi:putative bifunctional diguanylate cyclase/phosphodiesterase [Marinomonas sp. 2405UD68-3]|uniref:putative bifunctional diguanylate cyclase/phosphodiesterase n=1 Tax=Marinomonas sp. 2405UD68-3 TaxID=3391835 RepID=UPI0039C8CF48